MNAGIVKWNLNARVLSNTRVFGNLDTQPYFWVNYCFKKVEWGQYSFHILDPASRTLFLRRHHVSCTICFHSDCCSCPRPSPQGRLVCHISRGVFEMHLYVALPFQFCIVHVYSQSTSNTHAVMSFIWILFLCLFSFLFIAKFLSGAPGLRPLGYRSMTSDPSRSSALKRLASNCRV